MPLVSVIVPVYNYGHFLAKAAESLIAQTEKDWECLLVDDGSSDSTALVCEELVRRDSRFRYFFQSHRGLPAARNRGLREASGRFIQFLDADDWLEPGKLSHQISFLKAHPEIDLVYSDALYDDGRAAVFFWGKRSDFLAALARQNIAAVNSFLVRKSAAEEAGTFDESLGAYEDWDFWLRCALREKKFFYSPGGEGARAWVLTHSGSMIRDRKRMLEALVCVRRKHSAALGGNAGKINRRLLSYDEGRLAFEELKSGAVTPARVGKVAAGVFAGLSGGRGDGLGRG